MLSVSFSLAAVAAMLFGIVLPGHPKEVDSLNGPTSGPIPGSKVQVVIALPKVNGDDKIIRKVPASRR